MTERKANFGYLTTIYFVCGTAAIQCGLVLASYNTAGIIIEEHLQWPHWRTILITTMGIIGLALGSLSAERVLKYGRVKALYIAEVIIIAGVPFQMWLSVPGLCIGRLLCGFGAGICNVTSSIFMAETVPPKYLGLIGSAVNTGIVFGLLVSTFI